MYISDTIPDSYPDNGNCNWPYISRFRSPPVPLESHRIPDSLTFSHTHRKYRNHPVPSSEIHTVRKSSLLRSSKIHWSSYWSHFPYSTRPSHNDTSRINASADAQWFHGDTATYVSTIPAHESACHSPAFWKWIRLLFLRLLTVGWYIPFRISQGIYNTNPGCYYRRSAAHPFPHTYQNPQAPGCAPAYSSDSYNSPGLIWYRWSSHYQLPGKSAFWKSHRSESCSHPESLCRLPWHSDGYCPCYNCGLQTAQSES